MQHVLMRHELISHTGPLFNVWVGKRLSMHTLLTLLLVNACRPLLVNACCLQLSRQAAAAASQI
jgi:hypothetical protein